MDFQISLVKEGKKVGSFPVNFEGLSIDVSSADPPLVAVGGSDNKTHVYELVDNSLNEVGAPSRGRQTPNFSYVRGGRRVSLH